VNNSNLWVLYSAIRILVPEYKLGISVFNKFRKIHGHDAITEFDEVGQYHWDLSKVKIPDNECVGYLQQNYYHPNIARFNYENMLIEKDADESVFLRDADRRQALKDFNRAVNKANAILKNDISIDSV